MEKYLFTSESVCAGHPDKICDQISDAILDAILSKDPYGHVAIETLATYEKIVIAGEVKANTIVDYRKVARNEVKRLGYTNPHFHFSDASDVEVYVHTQSPEIEVGVDKKGAGDQGMMYGYACNETAEYMPLAIVLAHVLAKRIDDVREDKVIPFLYPDGKTQVSIGYEDGIPTSIEKVVIAVPYEEKRERKEVEEALYSSVVKEVLSKFQLPFHKKNLIVNGTGVWHAGGPASDTGLTGRKIIVDSYGGYARVGGGAFSGKDPTKVDRSGAYAARYLAKNIVAQNMAKKAEVRLAYIIGYPNPVSVEVDTFGTETVPTSTLHKFLTSTLDLSVQGIIETLDLRKPIYHKTASYGHFGRDIFPWEVVNI